MLIAAFSDDRAPVLPPRLLLEASALAAACAEHRDPPLPPRDVLEASAVACADERAPYFSP